MKKITLFLFILFIFSMYCFAHGNEPIGLAVDFFVNYGRVFNDETQIVNIGLVGGGPGSDTASIHYLFMTTFSPDAFIWDLYSGVGIAFYPFKRIFSISGGMAIGVSIYALLNHFPYLLYAKGNLDLPIYKNQHISFGAGVQHRNAIRIIGYIPSSTYYGAYNSWFFEVSYRYFYR